MLGHQILEFLAFFASCRFIPFARMKLQHV